jgi:PTS system nitrogen regulatory IIA component
MVPGFDLARLIAPDAVVLGVAAADARAALALLAGLAAPPVGLAERAVLDALIARERLGSTGVGHGVAIPHARLPGIGAQTGALLRLAAPVDFAAPDLLPCDLFVLLLAPADAAGDHLKALAGLSRRLREAPVRAALRAAGDPAALRAALLGA